MPGLVSAANEIERVQAALPFLDIDEVQLEKRPALTSLLLKLSTALSPNTGVLKSTECEYESACTSLEREFGSFVQERVLQDILENMLVEWSSPDCSDKPLNDESNQVLAALDEHLSLYELAALFSESGDGGSLADTDADCLRLPGLINEQHLAESSSTSPHLLRLPGVVEERLKQLSADLITRTAQLLPSSASSSGECTLSDLEALVAEAGSFRSRANSTIDQLLNSDSLGKLQQQAELVQRLHNTQLKLITGPMLKSESEARDIDTEYITANLKALELKARVTELQVRNSTYSNPLVQSALQAASSRLKSRCQQLQSQLDASRERLKLYNEAGDQLRQLVVEYQQLNKQLTQKRWLLKEMETMEGPYKQH